MRTMHRLLLALGLILMPLAATSAARTARPLLVTVDDLPIQGPDADPGSRARLTLLVLHRRKGEWKIVQDASL